MDIFGTYLTFCCAMVVISLHNYAREIPLTLQTLAASLLVAALVTACAWVVLK